MIFGYIQGVPGIMAKTLRVGQEYKSKPLLKNMGLYILGAGGGLFNYPNRCKTLSFGGVKFHD